MRSLRTRPRAAPPGDDRSYIHAGYLLVFCALCFSTLVLLAAPIPTGKPANYPGWWFSRGVIVPLPTTNTGTPVWTNSYPTSDDYAVINQGQLKNFATQAYNELQARLPSWVWGTPQGLALTSLVTVWNPESGDAYAVVNLGQLKTVAKPFYDVLAQSGYPNSAYPWTGTNADDYTAANIGQVKNLFSFDVSLAGPANLTATNGASGAATLYWTLPGTNYATSLLIEEENTNGTWNVIGTLTNAATTSYTLSGLTEGQNYTFQIVGSGTNTFSVPASFAEAYHSTYYGGMLPTLAVSSGNNQTVAASTFAALPLVVHVTNSGTNLVSAPVTFSVASGSDGGLSTTNGGTTSSSVSVVSNSSGLATAYYEAGPDGVANNVIVASAYAGSTFVSTNFTAYCGVQNGMTAWYKADTGVTTTNACVTAWNDQSTNGYNLTDSGGTNAPTPGIDPETDRPVVQFNGNQTISSGTALPGLTNATIIAVASNPTPSASEAIVDVGTTNSVPNSTMGLVYASGDQSFVSGWSGSAALINNGGQAVQSAALNLNTVTYSGSVASFYSNGVANGTASVTNSAVSGGISLGSLMDYYDWNGNIAEAVIYNRVLTTGERQQVETYLANKYDIAPVISSSTTATGISGVAFSYTVTASNGATSYSAVGLPAGLTINSSTGVISGTPTAAGISRVLISASSGVGTGTATLNLTIYPASAPGITCSTVASGVVGQSFNFAVTGSNGPTSYSVTSGTLPSGLTMNSAGVITGTPSTSGTTTVTVGATNAYGTGTQSLTIIIGSAFPSGISGLTAWFNGDAGMTTSNGNVTEWDDQSTNHYNISQTYILNEPKLTTDPGSGNSELSFNGTQSLSLTTSATLSCTTDVTIITVASAPVLNNFGPQVMVGNGTNSVFYTVHDGNQSFFNGATDYDGNPLPVGPALNIGSMTFTRSSGAVSFFSQGVANGTTTVTSSSLGNGLLIGDGWNGNIAEMLIYSGVLTTTQRESVEQYLANKYGIYAPSAAWIAGYSTAVQTEINRNQWNKAQADAYVALQTNNPSMLTTGLKLWLKADSGVTLGTGNNVVSWADQTGNYPLSQDDAVNQPTLVTNDCNGEPGIRFTGNPSNTQILTNAASLGAGVNADMTVITVGMNEAPSTGSPQYSVFIGNTTAGEMRAVGYNSSLEYAMMGTNATGDAAPPAGTFVAEAASVNSTLSTNTFYQNGTLTTTASLAGALNVQSGISVGESWDGDISEVLVYDHQLSTTELNQISLYLANKYGLYFNNSYGTASWISGYSSAVQTQINANQWTKAQADTYVQVSATLPVSTGIVAWFKADSGVSQDSVTHAVIGWQDSGPYYHNLSPPMATNEPTVVIDPTTGTQTVHFNGINQYLANSDSYSSITNITLVTVASTPSPPYNPATQVAVGYGSGTYHANQRSYLNYDYDQAFSEGSTYLVDIHTGGSAASTNALTTSAVTYSSSSSNAIFYSNGTSNGTATGVSASPVTSGLALGSDASYTNFLSWYGNISEVLIYNRVLSSTEIAQLQTNYFNVKYVPYSVAKPTISASGTDSSTSRTVTLSGATYPAIIRYTMDGSTPTNSSTQYTGPFNLTQDSVINFTIFNSSVQISPMATAQVWVGDANQLGIPASWFTGYGLSVPANSAALGLLSTPGGLTYLQAYQWGYNPTKFSSNGDGLSDLVNHQLGYAGNDYDINNYGLSNAQQLALGLDPFDVGVNPPLASSPSSTSTNAPVITLTQPSTNVILLP